jgi:hypothetical protein
MSVAMQMPRRKKVEEEGRAKRSTAGTRYDLAVKIIFFPMLIGQSFVSAEHQTL